MTWYLIDKRAQEQSKKKNIYEKLDQYNIEAVSSIATKKKRFCSAIKRLNRGSSSSRLTTLGNQNNVDASLEISRER